MSYLGARDHSTFSVNADLKLSIIDSVPSNWINNLNIGKSKIINLTVSLTLLVNIFQLVRSYVGAAYPARSLGNFGYTCPQTII